MQPFTPEPSGYENLSASQYAEKLLQDTPNRPIASGEILDHIDDFSGRDDDADFRNFATSVESEYKRLWDLLAQRRKVQQEFGVREFDASVKRIWSDEKYG